MKTKLASQTIHSIEEYLVDELVKDSSKEVLVRGFLQKLDKDQIVGLFDNFLDKESHQKVIKIPISIFKNRKLSSLELIIKFLKEEAGITNVKISRLVGRSPQVCFGTYKKSLIKLPDKLNYKFSKFDIPVDIFVNSKLSVLETIVVFLKSKNLNFKEIATLLNRDERTVWTVHNRAIKKGVN